MPDITMCQDESCPCKDNCYRFIATADNHQSYGDFKWDDGCNFYYPVYIKVGG